MKRTMEQREGGGAAASSSAVPARQKIEKMSAQVRREREREREKGERLSQGESASHAAHKPRSCWTVERGSSTAEVECKQMKIE